VADSIVIPGSTPSWEPSPWALFLRQVGLARGPRRRSPLALRTAASGADATHAEIFMSERTGDWIHVGCDCGLGADHWHEDR